LRRILKVKASRKNKFKISRTGKNGYSFSSKRTFVAGIGSNSHLLLDHNYAYIYTRFRVKVSSVGIDDIRTCFIFCLGVNL
jgi:hypothetical protein